MFNLNLILPLPREEVGEPWWPSGTPNIWRKTGNSIQKSTWTFSVVKNIVSQRRRTIRTTERCGRKEVFPRHIKQIVDLNLGSKTKCPNMCFVVSLMLFSQVPRYYLPNPF